jgi:hypothetical protein
VLHIVFGVLGLISSLIIFAIFGGAGGIVIWNGEPEAAAIIGFVALCIGGLIALLSAPSVIAGWALLAEKHWANTLMIAVAILDLFEFPLGTVLGIYTLWALFRQDPPREIYTAVPRSALAV